MARFPHPAFFLACLVLPGDAAAHAPAGDPGAAVWDFWVFALLALVAALYWQGSNRRIIRPRRAAAFWSGMAALLAALAPPLDELAAHSAAAHMVQHLLLIAVAAPLIVAARPLPALLGALPFRKGLARGWRATGGVRCWHALSGLWTSTALHTVAIWAWHMPAVYEAALADRLVHDLEHAIFLVTALLFWWAVERDSRRGRPLTALPAVAFSMLQMGFLAALMTFSPTPWYAIPQPMMPPLLDQHLAGLIMWVPGALPYMAASTLLVARAIARHPRPSSA